MKSLVLNFLFLILKIPLNLNLNASHKYNGFSKTLLEKSLEFILSGRGGTIVFDLSLMLPLTKIDFIAKEQSWKRYAFRTCITGYVKIIFGLPTEVIAFYI